MKYLKVFTDFSDDLEQLSATEVGRLFLAMLEYAKNGTAPDPKGNEKFLWSSVKKKIDVQRDNYEKQCETNKRIATERNEASRSVTERNEASQEQRLRTKTKTKNEEENNNSIFLSDRGEEEKNSEDAFASLRPYYVDGHFSYDAFKKAKGIM